MLCELNNKGKGERVVDDKWKEFRVGLSNPIIDPHSNKIALSKLAQ